MQLACCTHSQTIALFVIQPATHGSTPVPNMRNHFQPYTIPLLYPPQELEDKVLRLLRDSSGHLLDDEALISTLNNARTTSGEQGQARGAQWLGPCLCACSSRGCGPRHRAD